MKTNNTAPDALQIQQAPIQQNNIQVQKQQEGFYPATKVTRELGFLSNYLVYPEAWKNEMRERHAVNVEAAHLRKNHDLITKAYPDIPTNLAYRCASSSFKPMQIPAKETYKQKKERQRQDELAKRENPGADHYTYGMVQSTKEMRAMQAASIDHLPETLKQKITDNRVCNRTLRVFCNGYKTKIITNQQGQRVEVPATHADQIAKELDLDFCTAYATKKLEDRREYLDEITSSLLTTEIHIEMFSYNHLKHHAGEMRRLCSRFTYFKNIYEDPVNKPYFDSLSPRMHQLIKVRILDQYSVLSGALNTLLGAKAAELNLSDYIKNDGYKFFQELLPEQMEILKNSITARTEETAKLYQLDGELEAGFNAEEVPAYIKLKNIKKLMNDHPAQFEKHKKIIDKIYPDLLMSRDVLTRLSSSYAKCSAFQKTSGTLNGTESIVGYNMSMKLKEKYTLKMNIQEHNMDTRLNVIEHLMTKTKLTPDGKALLKALKKQ